MKRSKLVLVLACVTLVACAQEMTQREMLVVRQAVESRANAWVRTWNNADRDSLALFYHQAPELRVMWPDGGRTDGWEATEARLAEFYGGINYMNFGVTQLEVQVLSPESAITTFRHSTDIVQRNGQRQPLRNGQGMVLWILDPQDNHWKIGTSLIAVAQPSQN
ncbi:MAG: nuclear transport factor 2 family protein [Gemmatimonadales bacterium]